MKAKDLTVGREVYACKPWKYGTEYPVRLLDKRIWQMPGRPDAGYELAPRETRATAFRGMLVVRFTNAEARQTPEDVALLAGLPPLDLVITGGRISDDEAVAMLAERVQVWAAALPAGLRIDRADPRALIGTWADTEAERARLARDAERHDAERDAAILALTGPAEPVAEMDRQLAEAGARAETDATTQAYAELDRFTTAAAVLAEVAGVHVRNNLGVAEMTFAHLDQLAAVLREYRDGGCVDCGVGFTQSLAAERETAGGTS